MFVEHYLMANLATGSNNCVILPQPSIKTDVHDQQNKPSGHSTDINILVNNKLLFIMVL